MMRFHKEAYISFIIAQFTQKTHYQNISTTNVLVSCLKQVKGLILEFLVRRTFFSEKNHFLITKL